MSVTVQSTKRYWLSGSGFPMIEEISVTTDDEGVTVTAVSNEMPPNGTEISGGQYDTAVQSLAISSAQSAADAAAAQVAYSSQVEAARATAEAALIGLGLDPGVVSTILNIH